MRIGIDLGGTKIEGVALSSAGDILVRQRVATPRDYASMLAAITQLVHDVEARAGARGSVGIGIPGAIVPETGLVKNANSTWLNGQPLGADLEARLRRPVRLMNDANCFALSEASDGAAAGADVVFGVILGTGVGGGVVFGGRCHSGPNLVAGEWGHNPLPWLTADEYPGPSCYCGKSGCIEAFLSGPGFEQDHLVHTGESRASRDIVAAAKAGEVAAAASLTRYQDRLGRALASLVNLLDPDVIVLGGGMSNIEGLPEAATEAVRRYVFSDTLVTPIVRAHHGDSSGVRGAAWLWPEEQQPTGKQWARNERDSLDA